MEDVEFSTISIWIPKWGTTQQNKIIYLILLSRSSFVIGDACYDFTSISPSEDTSI